MAQLQYPWVYPGDFNERLTRSDLVVSGTIASTAKDNTRIIDGVELTANQAEISDRIFQGETKVAIQFLWFSPAPVSAGWAYSGPPLAEFKPGRRYLVFLRHEASGLVVAIPIYAIEVKLAPVQSGAPSDITQQPLTERKAEIAKELETAAFFMKAPAPGVTGEAATYFPYVVDLVGGCAEPFLRHCASGR